MNSSANHPNDNMWWGRGETETRMVKHVSSIGPLNGALYLQNLLERS